MSFGRKKRRRILIFAIGILLFIRVSSVFASKISGRVTDAGSGETLIGANIFIEGSGLGAVTDLNGKYVIFNVPAGIHKIIVTYIGYEKVKREIQVQDDRDLELNIRMNAVVVEGETVLVTAQAEAQLQSINQQLSSMTIKNIVSQKQIQQLPEANAAEAIGRLPSVSLERSGGEGTKVVIRGMASKYAVIQIDGVNMTATGEGDRSTDLSMISPYMLEGIELTKSVMANQEATATGGIVNFRIRKAPEKPTFSVITQGGYNSLRNSYHDFKISVGGSRRFWAKLLGVYAQVDYEEKDAGSHQLGGVSFSQENESAPVRTHSMQLMDIFRNIQRMGGALVMDYTLPSTTIKLSNFVSRINREETRYTNSYDFTQQGFQISLTDIPESWLTIMTNSLQMEHRWRKWEINSILSHSYSENILPLEINTTNGNSPANPFPKDRKSDFNVDIDPEKIPDMLVISKDDAVRFMYIGEMYHNESETKERDLAGELNLAYNLNISNRIKVKMNLGGKYKHKTKSFDQNDLIIGGPEYLNLIYDTFADELSDRTRDSYNFNDQFLYLEDFLVYDYKGKNFLNGRYDFGKVFNKKMFRRIDELAMKSYVPDNPTVTLWDLVLENFINSRYYDFHGSEDYHALYLMPEINVGTRFLFVPGVRYEANRTEYTGYRGNRLGVLRDWARTPVDTVTKVRKDDFILPMIQMFYKPTNWMTLKAGYTHTLQRPNYNNIMPGWVISSQGQIWNLSNFRLKPEKARNWDWQLSLHSNKIGLFSVGGFYKSITDMIFWTGQKVITDTAYFELPRIMNRQRAAWAVNNPYETIDYGYELEWQSNFWYLPGALKGLVVNVNYTRNKSEAEYLRTRIKLQVDPVTYKTTLVNEDTTYKSPMISQPDHLLNLIVGYDYRGFSIRWAMRYTSGIFKQADWYEKLRGYSTDFYLYDLAIKQKLPLKGLEFFLNVNNLTGELERDVINHMYFTRYLEDYGRSANIGLRYQF